MEQKKFKSQKNLSEQIKNDVELTGKILFS